MPPMRRSTGMKVARGPVCQMLVTSDGTISSAAACTGGIHSASSAIDTVGSPRPITPLITPASRNTAAAAAQKLASSFECVIAASLPGNARLEMRGSQSRPQAAD
jgi:hypothetical protein